MHPGTPGRQPGRASGPPHGGGSGAQARSPGGAGGESIEQRLKNKTPVQYFSTDQRRSLHPDLLGREAETVAKKLRAIPASQLRRFFGSVMGLKRRLELEKRDADFIRAEMAFLKAAAAYAAKRLRDRLGERAGGERADPYWIVDFFAMHANAVKDEKDFLAFARHFEAVMAYHECFETEQGRD